jgi:membrane-associated phospholipid phosphatase
MSQAARDTLASRFSRLVRWRWLAASALIWVVFAALSYAATRQPYLGPDLALSRWVQSADWGPLTGAFSLTTWLAGQGTVVAVLVVALVALVNWRAAFFAAVVEVGATQTYRVVNHALQVPRPTPDLVRVTEHPGAYGWPSGHASFALVQVALLVLCVAGAYLPRRALAIVAALGGLVVLTFVLQRVSVGAHWPSQTVGGLLVAAGWLTLALSIRWLSDPVVAGLRRQES